LFDPVRKRPPGTIVPRGVASVGPDGVRLAARGPGFRVFVQRCTSGSAEHGKLMTQQRIDLGRRRFGRYGATSTGTLLNVNTRAVWLPSSIDDSMPRPRGAITMRSQPSRVAVSTIAW